MDNIISSNSTSNLLDWAHRCHLIRKFQHEGILVAENFLNFILNISF